MCELVTVNASQFAAMANKREKDLIRFMLSI
jgi:hypothetical protein